MSWRCVYIVNIKKHKKSTDAQGAFGCKKIWSRNRHLTHLFIIPPLLTAEKCTPQTTGNYCYVSMRCLCYYIFVCMYLHQVCVLLLSTLKYYTYEFFLKQQAYSNFSSVQQMVKIFISKFHYYSEDLYPIYCANVGTSQYLIFFSAQNYGT